MNAKIFLLILCMCVCAGTVQSQDIAASPPAAPASSGPSIESQVNGTFAAIRMSKPSARERYLQELFDLGPRAEASVIEYLSDKDKSVVICAVRFLAYIRSAAALERIMGLTIHPNFEIRAYAVMALGRFKDDRAVKRLGESLMLDTRLAVRQAAAYTLGAIDNPLAVEHLVIAIRKVKGAMRDHCMAGLGKALEKQDYAPDIARIFEAQAEKLPDFLKMELVRKLGDMADRRSVPFMIGRLESPDPNIRALAAIGLGKIGDHRGIDPLRAFIKDKSSFVREHVQKSLIRITAFNDWNDPAQSAAWMTENAALIEAGKRYELVIEKSLAMSFQEWGPLFNELKVITAETGNAKVFSRIIARCLLSRNVRTNDFAMHCFEDFRKQINPALIYILGHGKTDALLYEEELFRACELAALVSYRYRIVENIPHIIAYLTKLEDLNRNHDLLIRRPVSYLCLAGMTSVSLGKKPGRWAKWWRKNQKRFLAQQP